MTEGEKRGLGASREENQGQETGRVLGLRLGWVCWNQACTAPCAELGKLDFLFPKKSSYIRLSGQRHKRKSPKTPSHYSMPPKTQGPRPLYLALALLPMALSPFLSSSHPIS